MYHGNIVGIIEDDPDFEPLEVSEYVETATSPMIVSLDKPSARDPLFVSMKQLQALFCLCRERGYL
jgi:hypothetical protein